MNKVEVIVTAEKVFKIAEKVGDVFKKRFAKPGEKVLINEDNLERLKDLYKLVVKKVEEKVQEKTEKPPEKTSTEGGKIK